MRRSLEHRVDTSIIIGSVRQRLVINYPEGAREYSWFSLEPILLFIYRTSPFSVKTIAP